MIDTKPIPTQVIPEATMPNNSSNCSFNDQFKYPLYSTAFSLVFILGMLFNMVALYIFICTLKQRNETTTYMLNLAICDTLFVVSLPFRIFYFINKKWLFGQALCKISVMLFYTNMYGSILFLTCICADRFLAIVYPLASRSLRTKRKAEIACCTVWLIVLSVSLSVLIQVDTSDSFTCFENFTNSQWKAKLSKVVVVIVTLGFVIPLLINVSCSMMILRTLRNVDTIQTEWQLNKAKILRMIVVHLLIFCVCFIPYNVNLIFYSLVRSKTINDCSLEKVVRTVYPIGLCLAGTNCCFDPVVYYFTSETIQKSIKRRGVIHTTLSKRYDNSNSKTAALKVSRAMSTFS